MTVALGLILTICTLQIIRAFHLNIKHHKQLSSMHGMIFSMTVSMLAGIFYGTIIGVFFNGNLFISTFISILIGVTIGFLAGIPFHIIAVIDGSVSGLMGGMMGAMLGDMITMSNPDATVKLLAFFVLMILLIITYLTEKSIKTKHHNRLLTLTLHPYLYVFVITILFIALRDVPIFEIEPHIHHNS
ncbi:hypothetical protein [Ornithinibacillus scapharcae]|uniref:hypothetical protein n=1 Tax=Ornithinibacillus scapharcae TaxID=1147159 RepID=UPI000225C016|nr:hypothetical protein [Ornithinibacillus scapharcae]